MDEGWGGRSPEIRVTRQPGPLCAECARPLGPRARGSARYCSNRCRHQAYNRRRPVVRLSGAQATLAWGPEATSEAPAVAGGATSERPATAGEAASQLAAIAEEERLKQRGMAVAAARNDLALEAARTAALELAASRGSVSIDDVRDALADRGIPFVAGNWLGSVFKGGGWQPTGEWEPARHAGGHRRMIRTWRRADLTAGGSETR